MSKVEILTKFIEDKDLFPRILKLRRGNRVATYMMTLILKDDSSKQRKNGETDDEV